MVRLLVKGGAYMEIKDFICSLQEECERHEECDERCIFYPYCHEIFFNMNCLIDMIEACYEALSIKEML